MVRGKETEGEKKRRKRRKRRRRRRGEVKECTH